MRKKSKIVPRVNIGIDIGGVIIEKLDGLDTTFFSDNFLSTPAVPNAIEGIREINKKHNVYLISKCGEDTQQKTIEWMKSKKFFDITYLNIENLHFCKKRKQKNNISKRLGIDIFVDDKLEVLSYLKTVHSKILFNPDINEIQKYKKILPSTYPVWNWNEARSLIEIITHI